MKCDSWHCGTMVQQLSVQTDYFSLNMKRKTWSFFKTHHNYIYIPNLISFDPCMQAWKLDIHLWFYAKVYHMGSWLFEDSGRTRCIIHTLEHPLRRGCGGERRNGAVEAKKFRCKELTNNLMMTFELIWTCMSHHGKSIQIKIFSC